jgi:hypothetical protein
MAQLIEHIQLPIRGLNLHVAQVGTGERAFLPLGIAIVIDLPVGMDKQTSKSD